MNKKYKNISKFLCYSIGLLFILWGTVFGIDFWRTTIKLQKPIFTIPIELYKDGGSGIYLGLGYKIIIEGNFMPLDELPGVTYVNFSLFGQEIKEVLRD